MARTGRRLPVPVLSAAETEELRRWERRRKTAQALALRARIILNCAQGWSNGEVALRLGVARPTVGKWRQRFAERRSAGLLDEPRSGHPRTVSDDAVEQMIVTDARIAAGGHYALEHALDGESEWTEPEHGQSDLACVRVTAAPEREFQALHGPAIHREGGILTRHSGQYA